MEKAKTKVKTTFRCNRCSNNLVIVEDKHNNVTFFGCPKCDCYIIVLPWQVKEFRRRRYFNWKGFMKYIYRSYVDARESVCK
jgi:ssDNA-binding Zn-finger/Zn-ribbon topoisomerase 1